MGGCDGVGHVSKSSGLLHVEASSARVYQFGLKTGGSATASGSMGQAASAPATFALPFLFYYTLWTL
jgi:hypothetical protein